MRCIAIILTILFVGCGSEPIKPVIDPSPTLKNKSLCKLTENDWRLCRQIAEKNSQKLNFIGICVTRKMQKMWLTHLVDFSKY